VERQKNSRKIERKQKGASSDEKKEDTKKINKMT
jgi:hypothetical protein